jgi:hypothetical protein
MLVSLSACSVRSRPAAPAPAQDVKAYLFPNTLSAESQVCVPASAWDSSPRCIQLGRLREQLREVRYARAAW